MDNPYGILLEKDVSSQNYFWGEKTRLLCQYPANIYLSDVNNRHIRQWVDICLKLTIKTPEQRQWCQWRRPGVFHNFSVSIVDFERVNVSWAMVARVNDSKTLGEKLSNGYLRYCYGIIKVFFGRIKFWDNIKF